MRNKVLTIICIIAAVICIIYGILIYGTGSGTGFFLVWIVLAVLLICLGCSFFFQLWERIPKAAVRVIMCFVLIGALIFGTIEILIARQLNASGEEGLDYVIVLGAQVRESGPSTILKYRLDCAAEYLKENPDTVCIVSGGQGYNEPFPEAEGMAAYLIGAGIPEERIVREGKSETTEENIKNSMAFIEEESTVGIVTNDFHVFRAMQTAKDMGLENSCGIAAGSPRRYLPNNMLREFFAEIKYLVF